MNKRKHHPRLHPPDDLRARARRWCGMTLGLALSLVLVACLGLVSVSVMALSADVVLVLDNSGSMKGNDPGFLAKQAVSKFVSELDDDTRVGIIIFAAKVDYAVTLKQLDVASRGEILRSLDSIDYRGQFTNSPDAIERAIYALKSDQREDATQSIVFMTDGIVDTGNAEVDTEKTKWMREELAADAADSGIKIFGIAFTENADFFLIQSLAKKTDGEYFRALAPEDLAGVFEKIDAKLAAPPPPEPAPPPAVTLAPPPPSAALGPCMSTLDADERIAFEEMAQESGITAEAFCNEMMQAPPGTAVVVPPMDAVAVDDDIAGLIVLAVVALGIVGVIVVLVLFVIHRRKSEPGMVQVAAAVPEVVPEAFLKDIHGVTDEPAIQLGSKPMMIGRVAGNDPEHLDYFVVNRGTVGRRHAIIKYRDFSFWAIDQGSVNGTYLNGERIQGERQLKHGDQLKFHKYEFEFSMPEMEDAGHTVFADPHEATMAGGATLIGSADALAADDDPFDLTAEDDAEPVPAADEVFDLTASPEVEPEPVGTEDVFDDDAQTALSARNRAEEAAADGAEVVDEALALPVGDSEEAFDAEASAFFAEESLGPADGGMDDDFSADLAPATEPNAVDDEEEDEESAEAATLQPPGMEAEDNLASTADISLDDFMDTRTFLADEIDAPPSPEEIEPGEDVTLMPEQVGVAPAIDDVFDITGEISNKTSPPGGPPAPDDDTPEEDDDDSESPTVFKS